VEGIRLWRANRQKLVGMVYLDKGVLDSVRSTKASGRRT